ncbi:tannase/feruloyl esterase family alpha/beta hydrolase [Actinocorallia herbida]|uniref:tannase/feruloyl esterase family alpha/beta hydrolase n=1 Tax=Actinocorallia herbida TaxID=58109 RepID=UPI0014770525|nr:tannase/feruloyl esterase family alpha/beta hydrolase [Actinocorallia herbida]
MASAALTTAGPAEAAIRACTVAAVQRLAPAGTAITAAVRTAGPDHCLVDGHATVASPGPWDIKFRLALPDRFAKRHFFFAQGGSGGGIVPWTGQDEGNAAAPLDYDFNELLGRGFAVTSMDKGTSPLHSLDFSWQADPVQKLNWDNRALETVAAVTQGLTRSFYGTRTLHRYVSGCSGGGMGSINNLRVHDGRRFDGVIVGSTVPLSAASALSWARILKRIIQNPDGWIPPQKLQAAQSAILAAHDGDDGEIDGIIADGRGIAVRDELLSEAGFTAAQIATFRLVTTDWTYHGLDEPVRVPGYSVTRPATWSAWFVGAVPPPWNVASFTSPYGFLVAESSFRATLGTGVADLDLDDPAVHRAIQSGTADGSSDGVYDFTAFRDSGGKLLTYFGVDDPAIPYEWSEAIQRGAAAYESATPGLDRWYRAYLVPGLMHCFGGVGPSDVPERMLDAMVNWVEKGRKPQAITTTRETDGRTFILRPERLRRPTKG